MSELEFSHKTRSQWLQEIQAKTHEALVVGGGIVGASVLRELSLRGIQAVLVDKGDFANATSSRSSKLIHGGLRYLEMFDFGLVFEALAERHWLLKHHPHLVSPLQFNIPIFEKKFAPVGSRAGYIISLGLWLYDALSLGRTPFKHGRHSRLEAMEIFPGIKSQGLRSSLYYADAMMLDDELVLECIYDAIKRQTARAVSYCEVESIQKIHQVYEAQCHDTFTGKKITLHAKEVIVCVGPWTEKIGGRILGGSQRKLKPSKGVHLVLPWSRLPLKHCLVMQAQDERIIFAIPRLDLGAGAEVVIVGTTDSKEEGDPALITANRGDVEYLLAELNEYFPEAKLTQSDLCTTFAGVRPLIDDGQVEAKTSREHEIWRNDQGIVFMAGGKYTTFRNIAEEIVEFAFPKSKLRKSNKINLSTPQEYEARFRAEKNSNTENSDKENLKERKIWGKFTEDWVKWKCQHHCPMTLEDVVFRRIPLWLHGPRILENRSFERVLSVARDHFQWSQSQADAEVAKLESKLVSQMRF